MRCSSQQTASRCDRPSGSAARPGQGPRRAIPEVIPVTTEIAWPGGAGARTQGGVLGEESVSPVLGCCSWLREKVNVDKNSNHLMTPERPGEQDEVGYRRDRLGVRVGGPTSRISDWP